jgi:hypothetical protein
VTAADADAVDSGEANAAAAATDVGDVAAAAAAFCNV